MACPFFPTDGASGSGQNEHWVDDLKTRDKCPPKHRGSVSSFAVFLAQRSAADCTIRKHLRKHNGLPCFGDHKLVPWKQTERIAVGWSVLVVRDCISSTLEFADARTPDLGDQMQMPCMRPTSAKSSLQRAKWNGGNPTRRMRVVTWESRV